MMEINKTARAAGLLYLGVVLTGIFSLMYVPKKLIDWDNATITANNIVNHEMLFRLGIACGILCYLFFLFLPLVLYKLLSHINEHYAKLMVLLAFISVPLFFMNIQHELAVLSLINGVKSEQLHSQILFNLEQYDNGMFIIHLFSGLWLFPFGYLMYKSGFAPKVLGVLLILGCFGYLINFTGNLLAKNYHEIGIARYVSLPASIGEIGTCLWLLFIGIFKKSQYKEAKVSSHIKYVLLIPLLMLSVSGFAQKKDTVIINPSTIKITDLPQGQHQYLVYFKKGIDSSRILFNMWNVNVYTGNYKGKQAIITDQYWEDNTEIIHRAFSVSDKNDFHPLYQKSWWKGRDTIITDFEAKTATLPDKLFRKNIDSSRNAAMQYFIKATDQYVLNWHLDLSVFSMLPYKEHRTFGINFYDAGLSPAKMQYYTVTGTAYLKGINGSKVDCWILYKESPNNKETFWISKKTKEVLKLEQQLGKMYRYKVKMNYVYPFI